MAYQDNDPPRAGKQTGTPPCEQDIDAPDAVERQAAALLEQAGRLVDALAARTGLDPIAFRCLTLLCRQGPLPVRRLAVLAGLTEHHAAKAVDRLERQGYAVRRTAPDGEPAFMECAAGPPAGTSRPGARPRADAPLVHPDRTRLEPALRDLQVTWNPLTRTCCDDLALVAGLLAQGRQLSVLVASRISPSRHLYTVD